MGKALVGCLGVLASIAAILGLLVAFNILHPFASPTSPTLTISPSSIKAETNCHVESPRFTPPGKTEYVCNVALTASGQSSLKWSASGGEGYGAQFNPQQGTLSPGQSVPVIIALDVNNGTIPSLGKTCPTTVNLIFTNETDPTNTVIVPWSC